MEFSSKHLLMSKTTQNMSIKHQGSACSIFIYLQKPVKTSVQGKIYLFRSTIEHNIQHGIEMKYYYFSAFYDSSRSTEVAVRQGVHL